VPNDTMWKHPAESVPEERWPKQCYDVTSCAQLYHYHCIIIV